MRHAAGSSFELLSAPVTVLLASVGAGQALKLNAPLAEFDHADVSAVQLCDDGATLLYLADHLDPGFADLYSVPTDGSRPAQRLTRAEGLDAHFLSFVRTPDRAGAVLLSSELTLGPRLWYVPVDGSAPARQLLTGSPPQGELLVSPDSTRVCVFGLDNHVWSVATDGISPALRLTSQARELRHMTLSEDGASLVVSVAPRAFEDANEVFALPTDGSRAAVPLVPPGSELSASLLPRLSRDQRWVVYGISSISQPGDVYRVPLDGSAAPLRLSTQRVLSLDTSPDGKELALYQQVGASQFELSLARIADGRLQPLRDSLPGSSPFVRYTPDGSALLHTVHGTVFTPAPLHLRHLGRRAPAELGEPLERVLTPDVGSFVIAPRGTHVVYMRQLSLFAHALRPGAEPILLGSFADVAEHLSFRPDGGAVLIELVNRVSGDELFEVPLDGSRAPRSLAPGVEVGQAFYDGSGQHVVIDGTLLADARELFTVPADGSQPPRRLNDLPEPYRLGIGAVRFSADGSRALYQARVSTSQDGLFSVPVDGSQPAVELARMGSSNPIQSFTTSPDGATTYFVAARTLLTLLFRVPSDGSSFPERLVDFSARRVLPTFRLTPDGARIVYLSTEVRADIVDLFSVPTDGSLARVQLSLTSTDVGEDFQLTADGARVVYRSSPGTYAPLRSVPTLGGAAPIELGLARVFELSADSTFVVSERVDGIYSARVDGSSPAVLLAPRASFRIGQESERVLLADSSGVAAVPLAGGSLLALASGSADQLFLGGGGAFFRSSTGPIPDLVGVAVDGSIGARILNPPLAPGSTLSLSRLSVPARRVVYLVDGPSASASTTLRSVRFDGGAPVTLNQPRDPGPRGLALELTPDGLHVVYAGEDELAHVRQLYEMPLAGGSRLRLNAPLPAEGDVQSFVVGPAGRALYTADQETPQVFELFSVEYD